MLHLWYHVPCLFTVAGSSVDKHNNRVAVSIAGRCLFTWFFLCKRMGLVGVYRWLTVGCTESHLISKGSVWFWSSTVTSREAHPQALCVPWCPCPPPQPQWVARGVTSTLFTPPCSLTEHLLRQAPPPLQPPQPHQSGVPSRGHGTFLPDTDARWPNWTVHTAPPVALGPQPEPHRDSWRTRDKRRRRRTEGTNSHKREQVELKLTGSAEQLNVRNCSQCNVWERTDKTYYRAHSWWRHGFLSVCGAIPCGTDYKCVTIFFNRLCLAYSIKPLSSLLFVYIYFKISDFRFNLETVKWDTDGQLWNLKLKLVG